VAWYLLKTDNTQITSTSYISGKVTIKSGATPGDTTTIQGIAFVSIPCGAFQMGSTTHSNERPVHIVTVNTFQMSAKEITNSQYAAYLNTALAAGEITATTSNVTGAKGDYTGQMYIDLQRSSGDYNRCWISYNGTSFSVATGKENWPVVCVTWYGSKAFALKYDFDLPREGEWEYAARGGKGYEYGTDDGTISSAKANYNSHYLKNVGSYPANPFGLYDLAGNVSEWCNDWYGDYSSENAIDPQGPPSGSEDWYGRVLRGGDWASYEAEYCRSAYRNYITPDYLGLHTGFRVVRR
jgi:formylglycine-generating enzyme required for sulfatase activity